MAFPLERRCVDAAEQALAVKFPRSYIRFMCSTNGGNTPDDRWILHPIADTSDRTRIKRTCNHIGRETEKARQYDGFPEGALVIGENMEGALLLFLPSPEFDHQLGDAVFASHPFHRELDKVVDDFSEFKASSS